MTRGRIGPDGPERAKPVGWLQPKVLVATAQQALLATIFERFADKREQQSGIETDVITDFADLGEMWIDYVSDIGDGFDATATVASLIARPTLPIETSERGAVESKRGSLLVLGGDAIYPYASIEGYEQHMVEPYRAFLPFTDEPHPVLLAVPGNHDWYDGLTAFLRVFTQRATGPGTQASDRGRWIGGWQTMQRRSYFAVQLPQRWWLWGIDIQLDTYIDGPQLSYFTEAGNRLQPGDAIILACAKPSWLEAGPKAPEAFAVLDFFEREMIRPTGATLRVSLTGDHHSYVRYEAADHEQKIMVGGGGAYLAATHHFPVTLELPPRESKAPSKSPMKRFAIAKPASPDADRPDTRYPTAAQSKAEARCFFRLLWRNGWGFPSLLAISYVLLTGSLHAFGWRSLHTGALALVVAVALSVLTKTKGPLGIGLGLAHTAAHLGIVAALAALTLRLSGWLAVPIAAVTGAIAGPLVFGLYFLVADAWFSVNTNELFASQRIDRYRCFLRLHINGDGALDVFAVGVDETCHDWTTPSVRTQHAPLMQPVADIAYHLIDGPFTVPRVPTLSSRAADAPAGDASTASTVQASGGLE